MGESPSICPFLENNGDEASSPFFQEWTDTLTFLSPLFSRTGKILGLSQVSSQFFPGMVRYSDFLRPRHLFFFRDGQKHCTRTFSCCVSFIFQEWKNTRTFSGLVIFFSGMDRYSDFLLQRLLYLPGMDRYPDFLRKSSASFSRNGQILRVFPGASPLFSRNKQIIGLSPGLVSIIFQE